MAVLEIQSNGDSSYVSQEAINSAIQSLEDTLQRVSKVFKAWVHLFKERNPWPEFFFFPCHFFRNLFRSVWRWTPLSDPQPRSCCFTRPCLRCLYSSCWLHTASLATSVSDTTQGKRRARTHNTCSELSVLPDCWVLCFPADMIPENALEEMTKNMDPNLVIVEGREGVQMK